MAGKKRQSAKVAKQPTPEKIYVGIDLHNKTWHVTIRTAEAELFSGSIEGNWEALRKLLEKYRGQDVAVVYEAGYFGYKLHDQLVAWGARCLVTPPSLIPQEYGNRVKTDRRDSRKLAYVSAQMSVVNILPVFINPYISRTH